MSDQSTLVGNTHTGPQGLEPFSGYDLILKTSPKGWQYETGCRELQGIPSETRLYGKYTSAGDDSKNEWAGSNSNSIFVIVFITMENAWIKRFSKKPLSSNNEIYTATYLHTVFQKYRRRENPL